MSSSKITNLYFVLTLTNTLAASFIWGINTLFLLDAGLSNLQAFLANAFFTLGIVIFEIPTGIIADGWGRKNSYMLGSFTLAISTLVYFFAWYTQASFIIWMISSLTLGLGFTFFSGATDAWLVDALKFTKFKGSLESVFAKGQIVGGIAMLLGSVAGGLIAQFTNLGIPYILRFIILLVNFVIAFMFMKDLGFSPEKGNMLKNIKKIFNASINHGIRKPGIRWVMLAAPFTSGAIIYGFYAMQPYLLELFGSSDAYWIAGIAAAVVALAQIIGGFTVPYVRKLFKKRTSILITSVILNTLLLAFIGITTNFIIALICLIIWAFVFAVRMPVYKAYLNELIPSKQRATVLSFSSLMGSSGGIVSQPALGKAADVWSYSISFILCGAFQILALPFLILARKQKTKADRIGKTY